MGVNADIIDKYSVYSMEVADEMSKCISKFASSNYGIGVTGKLNRIDKHNLFGQDNIVYISIYDKDKEVSIRIRISKDMKGKLEEITKNTGATMSAIIRIQLERYLKNYKDTEK